MSAASRYPDLSVTTRTIVTSQPDLPCDVCGRRLLRGERHDVFLAGGGRRLTVCELCAPRAAHEGWRRESAHAEGLELSRGRPRRARNLLGRLRQLRETSGAAQEPEAPSEMPLVVSARAPAQVMAEEFEPAEPLHGAGAPVAELEARGETVATVAAPVLEAFVAEPIEQGAESRLPAVDAWSPEAETDMLVNGSEPFLGERADGAVGDEHESATGKPDEDESAAGKPDEDEPAAAEGGSWRDAWMFVGE